MFDAPDKPNRYEGATVTPPSEDYLLIPLTQGQFAKVSPHRYEELSKIPWQARWSANSHGFYASSSRYLGGGKWTLVAMHRMILGLNKGDPRQADHINRDTLDNRDENLRVATIRENNGNRAIQSNNTSGYKGVSWKKSHQTWAAQITIQGKPVCLGHFSDPKEAHEVYCEAARRYFGEFTRKE